MVSVPVFFVGSHYLFESQNTWTEGNFNKICVWKFLRDMDSEQFIPFYIPVQSFLIGEIVVIAATHYPNILRQLWSEP